MVAHYASGPLLDVLSQLLVGITGVMRSYLFFVGELGRIEHEHCVDDGVTVGDQLVNIGAHA